MRWKDSGGHFCGRKPEVTGVWRAFGGDGEIAGCGIESDFVGVRKKPVFGETPSTSSGQAECDFLQNERMLQFAVASDRSTGSKTGKYIPKADCPDTTKFC
jgi:hypothetical protein